MSFDMLADLTPPRCSTGDICFPDKFLFGTAIAGFQADMGCPTLSMSQCLDPNSDWYVFATDPATVGDSSLYLSGQPLSVAPGFWELYSQDLDRAKNELKNNSFRLSIEWSRIFPTSTVGITGNTALKAAASATAIQHYHDVFAAMKARGLSPVVTVNHYALPSWIHDAVGCHTNLQGCTKRGWLDATSTVAEIAKFAGFIASEFGGEVDTWSTLNEPFSGIVIYGYLAPGRDRSNPPGAYLAITEAKQVYAAMVDGHAKMYDAIKANDTVDADGDGKNSYVGIVYNITTSEPLDPTNMLDVKGSQNFDYVLNKMFLNAIIKGDFDANIDGTTVHRTDLAGRLDYVGVNYYFHVKVKGSAMGTISPLVTFDPTQLVFDPNYPKGMQDAITEINQYGLPIIITENGRDDPNDDGTTSKWIVEELQYVKKAMDTGANVQGYFYWTLTDNYEWNHGMNLKFGLYGIDPADTTKVRHPRKGVATFATIASGGKIPASLAAQYPVP